MNFSRALGGIVSAVDSEHYTINDSGDFPKETAAVKHLINPATMLSWRLSS